MKKNTFYISIDAKMCVILQVCKLFFKNEVEFTSQCRIRIEKKCICDQIGAKAATIVFHFVKSFLFNFKRFETKIASTFS